MNKQRSQNRNTINIAIIGGLLVALVLIITTVWTGISAQRGTNRAVHSVSNFYLRELAGRRGQVVASNLQSNIQNMRDALDLLDENDLSDLEHLQAFQARMKKLYNAEKFAFVDTNGLIYTSLGLLDNIVDYDFDYLSISGPEVSINDIESKDKKVVIALPIDHRPFNGQTLVTCFMEIDMDVLLEGLSLQSDANEATFCNLYDRSGISLTNKVLGGTSSDVNLLDALKNAIRPIVVGRKNWLFCDTQAGASASVLIYSVLETAKANGLNPEAWLTHLLSVLPDRFDRNPDAAIDDLMPWADVMHQHFGL